MAITASTIISDRINFASKLLAATRAGIAAANNVMESKYKIELLKHQSKNPRQTLKSGGTKTYIPRPHLFELVRSKVWPYPDGTGFAGLTGAKTKQGAHAHLIEFGTVPRTRIKMGGWAKAIEDSPRFQALPEAIKNLKRRTGAGPPLMPMTKALAIGTNEALAAYQTSFRNILETK